MTDDQILSDAKVAFALCEEAQSRNHIVALKDLRFAQLKAASGRYAPATHLRPAKVTRVCYEPRSVRSNQFPDLKM
jgi:hypothetical protein